MLQIMGAAAALAPLASARAGSPKAPAVAPVVPEAVQERFASLPFESQKLGGLFAQRMQVNAEGRLLHIHEHELLKGFVNRDHGGDPEGMWLGEHAGKFLDAACNRLRYEHNVELHRLLERMAKTLISSQGPDGYLGTYPREKRWTSWDVWVHKYNLIGLLSYYEFTGDPHALACCRRMGDLLDGTFGDAPGKLDIITIGEHVGMASASVLEPMCRLFRFTGEPRYLEFCRYIVRAYDHPGGPRIVKALLEYDSVAHTANAKAYEMMSNFLGIIDLYRITGEQSLLTAVLRGWEDIARNQLYATGAISAGEVFPPRGQLLALQSSKVGETCAHVTWLQLNWRLFRLTGEARFGQEMERTVYNHLLGCQDARSGDIAYYTALVGPKRYRNEVLCCVSSGPRGISLIPQLAWGLEKDAFVVNLYTPGQAQFEMGGVPVQVRSRTRFPAEGGVTLTIHPQRTARFTVRLRVPAWVTQFEVSTGTQSLSGRPGEMLDVTQDWTPSTQMSIRMDMPTRVLPGSDAYPDYVAVQRGPQVLAMERAVNPEIPFLHRVALAEATAAPIAQPVAAPEGWEGRQVYELDAVVGLPQSADRLRFEQRKVRLVPFADAIDCRVWLTRADRMRDDVPALSAFAQAESSDDKQLPDGEFLTDENAASFCVADPRKPRWSRFAGRSLGSRGGPVWFSVTLDAPRTISRVVFRHGQISPAGGWFDTSEGKPKIHVARSARSTQLGFMPTDWQDVADVEAYPEISASRPPHGHFEVRLPQPMKVYAIRLTGKSAGEYVTCAELSAYA